MNVTNMLRVTGKVVAAAALTVVAATSVVQVNTASAGAGDGKPAVSQAGKEWKAAPASTREVVSAGKEWKVGSLRTKE